MEEAVNSINLKANGIENDLNIIDNELRHDGFATFPATPVQVVKPTMRLLNNTPMKLTSDGQNRPADYKSSKENGKGDHLMKSLTQNNVDQQSVNSNEEQEGQTKDEPDFDWNEYLEVCGSLSVPPTAFLHVENSLQNMYSEGMKLEVNNRESSDSYWIASIMMTCGPLLRLRYEGFYNDMSRDFWCDIACRDVHPLGWCAENGKILEPPPEVQRICENWNEILQKINKIGCSTVPSYLLEASGCTAVDQIKQGMKLEIQDVLQPNNVWIATVLENVGGRLLLRYDGAYLISHDFWIFYLSHRVHPISWAKENGCQYKPPSVMLSTHISKEWEVILKDSLEEASKMLVPPVIFKCQEEIEPHDFQEGMKLEAFDPLHSREILPATVTKVLNIYYFLVQIDLLFHTDSGTRTSFCCHSRSPNIFPVGWACSSGVKISYPRGLDDKDFDWDAYLEYCSKKYGSVKRAPEYLFNMNICEHEFEVGMKLEAVNPLQPHQICAATVIRVVNHLLWIQLDNLLGGQRHYIVPVTSHDLFPVGWCESNNYPLKIPLADQQEVLQSMKKVAIVIPKKQTEKVNARDEMDFLKNTHDGHSLAPKKAWCPEIYINHKCFSGPFLSKSRIASLPRLVGPGPVTLVLREVISMLVNVSYLPSRVLSVLQAHGEVSPGMQHQLIKAKYKFRSYRAMVEIIRNSDKVAEFCRGICQKLQCCSNLISPEFVGDKCSENCYTLTKTNKTTLIKRGKRRKKHRHRSLAVRNLLPQQDADDDDEDKSEDASIEPKMDDISEPPRQKRKYVHRVIPKSDIVTRGAKLPNFALELRRRHRKNARRIHSATSNVHPANSTTYQTTNANSCDDKVVAKTTLLQPKPGLGDSKALEFKCVTPSESSADSLQTEVKVPLHEVLKLNSNPLHWTISEVVDFIKTTDCSQVAHVFREQEIDGQALLLLTLPTIQEYLELKLGPAIKLCHHIERIKMAFYSQYAE